MTLLMPGSIYRNPSPPAETAAKTPTRGARPKPWQNPDATPQSNPKQPPAAGASAGLGPDDDVGGFENISPYDYIHAPPPNQPDRPKAKAYINSDFVDFDEPSSEITQALIDKFRVGSFATNNKFVIRLFPPSAPLGPVSGAGSKSATVSDSLEYTRHVELRAETCTMPGRNLNTTTDSNIYGPTREIVNGAGFSGEVSISFNSDIYLSERVFFERWQERAYNTVNWNAKYYDDYVGYVEIYSLDKKYGPNYGVRLHEAYPKTIGPLDLNSNPNGELLKIPVNITYRYWTTLNTIEEFRQSGHELALEADEDGF